MSNWKYHLRSALLSAFGFGSGFVAGAFLSVLIFEGVLLDRLLDFSTDSRLGLGIVLILVVTGLGGIVGGAVGGLTLSYAHLSGQRVGYAWRGALSFGIGFALIVVPLTLGFALMSFYELAEASPVALMIPLGVMGAIFGAVSGAILGLLTVGWAAWRVMLIGTLAFGLGGAGLGQGLFGYLTTVDDLNAARWSIFLGIFVFGAVGGGALGFLYSWLAHRDVARFLPRRFAAWYKRAGYVGRIGAILALIILFLAIRAIYLISPFTAYPAPLANTLESTTIGTHWSTPVIVAENGGQPAISASRSGAIAAAWVEGADLHYRFQTPGSTTFSDLINVSNSATQSELPQLGIDSTGQAHLVWVEADVGTGGSEIMYSRCNHMNCTQPVQLSNVTNLKCLAEPGATNNEPAIAIDSQDELMVAWVNNQRSLLYTTWSAGTNSPVSPSGCIPGELQQVDGNMRGPRLAAGSNGDFSLVYSAGGGIDDPEELVYVTQFTAGDWLAREPIGVGSQPEVLVDRNNQQHVVWCGTDQVVNYWHPVGQGEQIPFPNCTSRPALEASSDGSLRLIWYTNEVETVTGGIKLATVLVESIRSGQGWTDAAVIAPTQGSTTPVLDTAADGSLYLGWAAASDTPTTLFLATYTDYDCSADSLSAVGQDVLEVVRQEKFRPTSDIIPYCGNQFDRMLYAPNPVPAYSDATPTPNGTFDKFAELAKTAQYEVVFATMWYDPYKAADNPGRVLGKAIIELYQSLKADPSRYPRGLTVRILLGNPPSFAFFPNFNNQVWSVLDDLRASGVPEMENEEIGWKLEVANFSGAWPHSHTKMMVVDGKTVQSVGYNMQHSHLPTDHPSGKGKGRIDMGIQVTGPVAQSALRAFDDLWQASTVVHCPDLAASSSALGRFSCSADQAVAKHVPEVLKYFVSDGNSNAFAIYRTEKFKEGDEAYAQAMALAKSSIDTIHINFSLELICALNILVDACNYANRIEYMDALMQAIEQNDVKVRILVSDVAWVGIENNIAIDVFEDELAARGLSDNVEIRYFEQDMHVKSALVDGEFLIIGNQNFHYSAWGSEGSLAESNISIDNPDAIRNYQEYFNYYWDRATKRETKDNNDA